MKPIKQNIDNRSALAVFAWPVYFVAVLMIVLPPLDVVFNVNSLEPDVVRWRFGFAGLLTGVALLPITGVLLALLTAHVMRHVWMRRVLTGFSILAVLAMMGILGMFMLDGLQLRRSIQPAMQHRFDLILIKSVLTQVAGILGLAAILGASMIAAKRSRGARAHAAAGGPDNVLIRAGRQSAS